jgi:hypothetical protein
MKQPSMAFSASLLNGKSLKNLKLTLNYYENGSIAAIIYIYIYTHTHQDFVTVDQQSDRGWSVSWMASD